MHGTAGAAAVIQAIKASGAVVRLGPEDFLRLVNRNPNGLVVHARAGLFWNKHAYLMGYRGLAFYTRSPESIPLPSGCELVEARRLWMPG